MSIPRPHWFRHDQIMVCTAPTCGISKSGGVLAKFDPTSGRKIEQLDDSSGGMIEAVDDQLLEDMTALREGRSSETLHFVDKSQVSLRLAVPTYYDRRYHNQFIEAMRTPQYSDFSSATLEQLVSEERIVIRRGHGSAPKDLRTGEVPYIKVSDLRAGQVNVNPTNRVPLQWAQQMWDGPTSGLLVFDLICPERASKNIGDFCVLMPGQEQLLITREVLILRAGEKAEFDQFYLLWTMTLNIVRQQWNRVIFMQTNREDVGQRYLEIEVPVAPNRERAQEVSEPFRRYFTSLATERDRLRTYLRTGNGHHFFLSGADEPVTDDCSI